LTPWAAPAASFIRRPISSKNRLLVWVIVEISGRLRRGRQRFGKGLVGQTMAIRTALFKAGVARPVLFLAGGHLALSWSGFLAIVSMRAMPRNRQTEERKETP
jgi:hypothetical protein